MNIKTNLDKEKYYSVFKANDARFDGRIFVGVSSTGIYCRPVCRAKMPKKENCTFYSSATSAESAGYRPCLICRPELAPGFAPIDASSRIVQKATLLIDENFLSENNIKNLAKTLNITDRSLRRVFLSEYGVSPIQYLQTNKLLLAKNLLTDTNLSITDIAFTAGFGSIRRFNTLFKNHYRMSPSALRKQIKPANIEECDSITLYLGYRPPYNWNSLLAFLANRTIPGVETVSGNAYHRTVIIQHNNKDYRGWISVRNSEKNNTLAVTISVTLLPILTKVLSRVKYLFDLHCDPIEIYNKLQTMNTLKNNICVEGTRLPGSFDPFEMAVRAVLGQQITVKAAQTLAGRFALNYGTKITTPINGLTHTFPTPEDFCKLDTPIENHLGSLGVTGARSRSIFSLASEILNGNIDLSRNTDPNIQMQNLLKLPGFGPWTVQYIAMRALNFTDSFLSTDYGIKKALTGYNTKEIMALSEQWSPWRSYSTINLWNSL